MAVIRALAHWRHLLLGAKHQVVVWTDHNNLTFYRHPQTISSQVARYILQMAEYDLVLKHKPGTSNRADYLSRPLGVDRSVKNNENVTVLPNWLFACALNLEDLDQEVQQSQGKPSKEWKEQYGLINLEEGWTRQGQLAVGDIPELCRHLIAAHHDHATAGHPGIQRTISLISQRYWWPGLREFVRNYVKGCATCQATKAGTMKPRVPLFPITARHALISFGVIALDLIVNLPPSEGYDSILTITDHDCTKASLFFPCKQTITSQGVAALYAKHVFPHFGIPNQVISDRDTRFTSNFTTELCKQLDVTQNISTTYHPQTDCYDFSSLSPSHTYYRLSSPNPACVPCFVSHVTFPFTVTLLFIITCRRGSSSSLSRTLTHYAYLLIPDTSYDS